MAAVNTIHQKIVKKEWAPHSFEAIACCVMMEARHVGCCIRSRHFYKFDGSGKKDQSQVALIMSNARSG
jgi:hypothetical protein